MDEPRWSLAIGVSLRLVGAVAMIAWCCALSLHSQLAPPRSHASGLKVCAFGEGPTPHSRRIAAFFPARLAAGSAAALPFLVLALWFMGRKDKRSGKTPKKRKIIPSLILPSIKPIVADDRVVSIMFIDIVGFSLAAEREPAEAAFRQLKKLFGDLADTIHRHGGVVDKSTGDGLLAYFGYHPDGSVSPSEHGERALRCACEIQVWSLSQNLGAQSRGEPVFPLRIGVNTANVHVGDIGSSSRFELTLIGHGVNLAKRLETACDNYCVMIGSSTKESLSKKALTDFFLTPRLIHQKHDTNLVEAFECDPFRAEPERKESGLKAYRKFARVEPRSERFAVPKPVKIQIASNLGTGWVVDFSRGGLGVVLDRYLGRGVCLELSLEADASLATKLQSLGLAPLSAEVRWGRPRTEGFHHGLQLLHYSENHARDLLAELQGVVSRLTVSRKVA